MNAVHPEILGRAVNAAAAIAKQNHRCFADIQADHFKVNTQTGRWYADYYDERGRKRKTYRSRWLWIKAYGPIPKGHHVHHQNRDHADDRLENLELLSESTHVKLHGAERRKERWPCETCGKLFRKLNRGKRRTFCSFECYRLSFRKVVSQ